LCFCHLELLHKVSMASLCPYLEPGGGLIKKHFKQLLVKSFLGSWWELVLLFVEHGDHLTIVWEAEFCHVLVKMVVSDFPLF